MIVPNRLNIETAEKMGYTVDTCCYPYLAYKGARFNPTETLPVFTELEWALLCSLEHEREVINQYETKIGEVIIKIDERNRL